MPVCRCWLALTTRHLGYSGAAGIKYLVHVRRCRLTNFLNLDSTDSMPVSLLADTYATTIELSRHFTASAS